MRHAWLVVAALAACFAMPALAAGSNPNGLGWSVQYLSFMSWNDLQSTDSNTVFNTTGCSWNDMDDILASAGGKISAGQTTSETLCNITDYGNDGFTPHLILYQVQGGSGLTITLSDDRGDSWTQTTKGHAAAEFCVHDPVWTNDTNPADYPPIDGTNGGVGYVTHWTLTVTAAKTSQVGLDFEIAPNASLGEYGYWRALTGVPCP